MRRLSAEIVVYHLMMVKSSTKTEKCHSRHNRILKLNSKWTESLRSRALFEKLDFHNTTNKMTGLALCCLCLAAEVAETTPPV
jgi:hypothetical protein